ncbi:haloacid dehalogenase superfamily, subfamily IA, variant 3 with third motif having DD or ED/haloacid dehalogenase superfamily, subfamily IA, variant 1 with third motif having Dx(3-4)D or Dx(3-4)E [Pseudomonas syringae]|uniref:HAD family hydrolase n=1 Tax=Pseudomonas syringae pv. apii TaxID=81036 RepID=A0A3M3RCS2_9PSED|nr:MULTISPECIES: HAD family hydrolase [Pseudomonas syringae group]RMN47257.1 HAD-superfamily hydrolase [Pseudomonas syringae pv. apii]RMN58211.1 HAD-superfamily hydrolase [Pseudomonas syringae pv. apii]RMN94192.1 HAD family hydrolase [Pseudomonas syringae pv. apii]SDY05882.1 haloacid dehalogenase superfamily, subfamily IA, variant 3 with third motif having DD or ED/haloacid dehalogenase superfamily, subfamily IA, variant 1 with third motif having Dx(3-4)D or Dx(3-4)E [Pseudomonas syringae]
MTLDGIRHWVFDMDGTLTVPVHDFPAIKRELGIPQDDDILGHLAALPADESAAKHAWLLEHERTLALGSLPADGAVELVRELAARGYRLGILTRNARELAHITLQAIGLADCFAVDDVLGRDEATPKPDPAGLLKLASAWRVEPQRMVMIGDYLHDLSCGRAAGAKTILVNLPDNPWPELTDWHAVDCTALRGMLG